MHPTHKYQRCYCVAVCTSCTPGALDGDGEGWPVRTFRGARVACVQGGGEGLTCGVHH